VRIHSPRGRTKFRVWTLRLSPPGSRPASVC
jgi:hypothetical protein